MYWINLLHYTLTMKASSRRNSEERETAKERGRKVTGIEKKLENLKMKRKWVYFLDMWIRTCTTQQRVEIFLNVHIKFSLRRQCTLSLFLYVMMDPIVYDNYFFLSVLMFFGEHIMYLCYCPYHCWLRFVERYATTYTYIVSW